MSINKFNNIEIKKFQQSVLENILEAVFLLDKNAKINYVNKSAIMQLGYSKEELFEMSIFDINYTFSLEQWQKYWEESTSSNNIIFEAQHKTKNGYMIPVEVSINFFDCEGVIHNLMLVKDITEKKKTEKSLYQFRNIIETTQIIQKDLHKTQMQLKSIISNLPDMLWLKDISGFYLECNKSFENYCGKTEVEIIGKTDYDFLKKKSADICKQSDMDALSSNNIIITKKEFKYPDNGLIGILEVRKTPIYKPDGEFLGILGTGRDITELKEYEQKLKESEKQLKDAQKIAKIGNWALEFQSLKLHCSDEMYRIFEINSKDKKSSYEHFLNYIHPDDRAEVNDNYINLIQNKTPYDITYRILLQDNKIKYIHERGETTYNEQGAIGTIQDVTEQKIIEQQIEHIAHYDSLTGLPNRILTKERVQQAIEFSKRHNSKMALLFIDIDAFKTINDSMGHSVGDEVLKVISMRLKNAIRVSDTISRQGGDEFLIILSDIRNAQDIIEIAEKLLYKFEKPFEIYNHSVSTTASVGIAIYPNHGNSFDTLLQNADAAMYKAKEKGKNTYCFYTQEMNHNITKMFKIQNDLKKAIKNNEFVLHYQPQIDLAKNRTTGAEALIRWEHPELGLVPPIDFIPIAESSGLIVLIGEWVINKACRQAALWAKKGINITMAVNISAMQFKRGNLKAIVKNALHSSGLNPKSLELELTESIMINDVENVLKTAHSIKELGVSLSIDDFGTGYSSLTYLKRFAVDKLKIDQSFIRGILGNNEDLIIVQTIIQMAKNLNLKTIAEGVETKEILDLMHLLGCDEVQGYHFAKPMQDLEFQDYFRKVHNSNDIA